MSISRPAMTQCSDGNSGRLRVSQADLDALRQAFSDFLPPDAEVFLFGSRTDPRKRGGDMDLLVHVPGIAPDAAYELRKRLAIALLDSLDEQKIDLVVTPAIDESASAFIRLAVLEGVLIWP